MTAVGRRANLVDTEVSAPFQQRRKVARHRANAIVQVSNAAGLATSMRVIDLSTHGCSINGDASTLRLGMILSINLGDDRPIQAIIRWVRGEVAGIEFFRPLIADQSAWRALLADQGF